MPIEAKNIHKKLGENIILADASIEIADGGRVAIVGSTGEAFLFYAIGLFGQESWLN